MKKSFAPFLAGGLFALGLCISGMTNTKKVLGFLDITGHWDASLIFVMVGAIAVHATLYLTWIKHRSAPLAVEKFYIPEERQMTSALFFGSALFGVGWGLVGYCPGPALLALLSLNSDALIFVGAMFCGMLLFDVNPWPKKSA